MTNDEINKLRALCAKAPAEIKTEFVESYSMQAGNNDPLPICHEFYEAARTALPAALNEVERLRSELAHANESLLRMTEVAVSRASIATLTEFRTRITRLTLAADLPREVWAELCRIDSDFAEMGVPTNVRKEQA